MSQQPAASQTVMSEPPVICTCTDVSVKVEKKTGETKWKVTYKCEDHTLQVIRELPHTAATGDNIVVMIGPVP